jgi:8-hydroxy-5-deazaflavin:NADPH oxidoreductase
VRIGVIGAGRIGGNIARLLARAGHEVALSFARDPKRLEELAVEIGERAQVLPQAEAAQFGDVVVLSVPWSVIDDALEQAGSLAGKIVIDTTNQFGEDGLEQLPDGLTAAQVNARRMSGARLVKAYNTLTAGFQAEAAGRSGPDRVVMFMCGDDEEAKQTVARLIDDSGFTPVDIGGLADATPMEAPRRPGAVYGEEYREAEARSFVRSLHRV